MDKLTVDFFYLLLKEELEVDDTKELRKREGEHMKISMPVLENIPGRAIKQYTDNLSKELLKKK